MTSIEKLAIQGIRCFAPDHEELIKFFKPVTVRVARRLEREIAAVAFFSTFLCLPCIHTQPFTPFVGNISLTTPCIVPERHPPTHAHPPALTVGLAARVCATRGRVSQSGRSRVYSLIVINYCSPSAPCRALNYVSKHGDVATSCV